MVATPTTTIRVSSDTRDRLKALSARVGKPAGEIVAELVRSADDDQLLADATEAFAAMDPDQIAAYSNEAHEIETSFGDPAGVVSLGGAPEQGEVFWADPDPTRGSEQAKARPFVVVSVDQLNRSPLQVSLAAPLTRTNWGNPLHILVVPPEGGLRDQSYVMPEQLRAFSHDRFSRRLGRLRPVTMEEILRRCRLLLR